VIVVTALILALVMPKEKEYVISFNINGQTTTQILKEGEYVSVPQNPVLEGYNFIRWECNGNPYDFSKPVEKDIVLVAKFEKIVIEEGKEYTVLFDTDDGSTVPSQKIKSGEKIQEPEKPLKPGYIFEGWLLNGQPFDFNTIISKDIKLEAKWKKEPDKFTVSFNTNGGSTVKSQTVEEGKTVSKPTDPTKSGYRFAGWTLNGKVYNFGNKVTGNITLTASWTKIEMVTVTFNTDGGSAVKSQTIEKGKTASKPTDPTKSGYRFAGWTLNGNTYNFGNAVNSNIELKATWNKIEMVTVTFNTDGGSNVATQTIEKGKVASKPTDPTKSGYRFAGWTLNGNTYNFGNAVNSNIELKATWNKIEMVTVTFNTDGGSSVASQTIEKGKTASKPTDPTKSGYTFNGWTLNGQAYTFGSTVNSNIELKATWKQKTYTISISFVDAMGSSPDRYLTVYENGSPITVSGLMYTDGVSVPVAINGTRITASNSDISGERTFKVRLSSGTVVTATVN
ncbi:MAG: InlB B-repeat-containing protein, partial [Clostridia bacterium]|nr:InlB B-repeat-containing protein [Clostridia bacterium]